MACGRRAAAKLYTLALAEDDWEREASRPRKIRIGWVGEHLTADTARKLAFLGVMMNLIIVVLPGVGTLLLFPRFQSLLVLLGLDASFSWAIVIALFAGYVVIGMILPIIALQRVQPSHWYAVPLVLLVAGAVSVLSLGGVVLFVAGVLLMWAGPDKAGSLRQPPEGGLAEALGDQMSPPRPATTCPICGAALAGDEITCPACQRRSTIRG